LPGFAAVAGTQDRAALADSDDITADDCPAEQQHAGRRIGLGEKGWSQEASQAQQGEGLEQLVHRKKFEFRNPKSETSTKSEFRKEGR